MSLLPSSDLWGTLHRLQLTLSVDSKTMSEYLGLTEKQYLEMKSKRKEVSVSSLMALTDELNISFDALMLGNIDYKALTRHFYGDESYLPEKYAVGAFSKKRTVMSILEYVDTFLGWEKRTQLLKRFQMTEAMFTDPDQQINIRFGVDVCNYLKRYHGGNEIVTRLGKFAISSNRSASMKGDFKGAKSVQEVYEIMFSGVAGKFIEQNYEWHIRRLNSQLCEIEGKPNSEIVSLLGESYLKSPVACEYRIGFISAIPEYGGFKNSIVKKISCVAQGDSSCRYHLTLIDEPSH